jgi:septal ring factor EnvC (AmiA/AmiB activator)
MRQLDTLQGQQLASAMKRLSDFLTLHCAKYRDAVAKAKKAAKAAKRKAVKEEEEEEYDDDEAMEEDKDEGSTPTAPADQPLQVNSMCVCHASLRASPCCAWA